jgi:hypothetical protein
MGYKHRGCFLYIIAASVEEGIEGKLGSSFQIEAFLAPRNCMLRLGPKVVFGVETDAGGSLLVEGLHIAVKALFAHHQPGILDEFFW